MWGQTPGKVTRVGEVVDIHGEWKTVHSEKEFEDHTITHLCRKVFGPYLRNIDCIQFGTGARRLHVPDKCKWSVFVMWNRLRRAKYSVRFVKSSNTYTVRDGHMDMSFLLLHSYSHVEDMEEKDITSSDALGDLSAITLG